MTKLNMNSGINRTTAVSKSITMKHRLLYVHHIDITKFLDAVDLIGGIVVAVTPAFDSQGYHFQVIYKAPDNSPILDNHGNPN